MYSRKTRFWAVFQIEKNFPKTTFSKYFEFSSDMSIPARPMELRKKFHRLTHICSIRPQWNFCNDTFSYVRMIHFKPWKPIFQCKFKKHVFELFFNWKKNEKTRFWTVFKFNSKTKIVFGAVFSEVKMKINPKPCFLNSSHSNTSSKNVFFQFKSDIQLQKRLFWIE